MAEQKIEIFNGPNSTGLLLPWLAPDQVRHHTLIFSIIGAYGEMPRGEFHIVIHSLEQVLVPAGYGAWDGHTFTFTGSAPLWRNDFDKKVRGTYSTKTRKGLVEFIR